MDLSRRTILAGAVVATGAAIAAPVMGSGAGIAAPVMESGKANQAKFSLKFAPHEGSFASRGGRLEQIAYAADQGFTAWEDNEAAGRSIADQTAMARALEQRGMTMGVFVASMPRWAEFRPLLGGNDDSDREAFLADIRASVDVAKRLNAKNITIVTGFRDRKLPIDIQTARVIDVLRRAAEIYEPHGLVMVMEPLNTLVDHPNVFMETIPQGFAVARAINSPAMKILADLYHAQIQAGNLINTLKACWSEITYIQFGDNPGRKEPGSGEINYRNVVRWLKGQKYQGVIGMEHGNAIKDRAGEDRLIDAYRMVDAD